MVLALLLGFFKALTKSGSQGYLWGHPVDSMLSHLSTAPSDENANGFDLLILADVLFNHSEHGALLTSIHSTLKCSFQSKALVFFTPYRPWLLEKDMAFFRLAAEAGFVVDKIFEEVLDEVMFEEDPGVSLCSCLSNSYHKNLQKRGMLISRFGTG